jgi:hypothetical protein
MSIAENATNGMAMKVAEYLGLVGTGVEPPRPPPPAAPEPSDNTHRFYLCRVDKDRIGAWTCVKKMKADAEKEAMAAWSQVEWNQYVGHKRVTHYPADVVVPVAANCPQMMDQLVLSKKVNGPVSLRLE